MVFCYEYAADLLSLCASARYDARGRTPYELVTHYTPDISEYVTFSWYQWCYYWDVDSKEKKLCRWLGPSHQIGQSFCSWILLLDNAHYIARSTVIPVPSTDLQINLVKESCRKFTDSVESKIGNHHQAHVFNESSPHLIYYNAMGNNPESDDYVPYFDQDGLVLPVHEQNEAYFDELDKYIGAKVVVLGNDGIQNVLAEVKRRKRDAQGNLLGKQNENPILDTSVYELEFPDGRIESYATNVIAQNLYSVVENELSLHDLFEEIIAHRVDKDVAVPKGDGYAVTGAGYRQPVITTKG